MFMFIYKLTATRNPRAVGGPVALDESLLVIVLRSEEHLLQPVAAAERFDVPATQSVVHSCEQIHKRREYKTEMLCPHSSATTRGWATSAADTAYFGGPGVGV